MDSVRKSRCRIDFPAPFNLRQRIVQGIHYCSVRGDSATLAHTFGAVQSRGGWSCSVNNSDIGTFERCRDAVIHERRIQQVPSIVVRQLFKQRAADAMNEKPPPSDSSSSVESFLRTLLSQGDDPPLFSDPHVDISGFSEACAYSDSCSSSSPWDEDHSISDSSSSSSSSSLPNTDQTYVALHALIQLKMTLIKRRITIERKRGCQSIT